MSVGLHTPKTTSGLRRWIAVLVVAEVVIFLLSVGATLYLNLPTYPRSPFQYQNLRVAPNELCPGQALIYDVDVYVDRVPTMVGVTDNVWDLTNERIVLGGQPLRWAIFTASIHSHYSNVPVTLPVLPPGLYEYRRAGSELNSQTTFAAAQFTIKACP